MIFSDLKDLRPATGTKIDYIERELCGSLNIDFDMCAVKKQGPEYVLFFDFSFRMSGKLIVGVLEAGDDEVHVRNIECFGELGVSDFSWLEDNQLSAFKLFLESKLLNK